MKKIATWCGLALLVIPGCLLVQPLDQAKPDDDGSAGSENGSSGGSSKAGNNGSSGNTSKAGSGNAGRAGSANGGSSASGGAPTGNAGRAGAPSGGAPGVDFSLFTGTWTVTGGESITICEGEDPLTDAIAPGGKDTVGLGTSSDLIFGPGSSCEILADVDDHNSYLNSDTLPCASTDGEYNYYLTIDAFHFDVSGDGQTANAGMITTVVTTDLDDNPLVTCEVQQTWGSER